MNTGNDGGPVNCPHPIDAAVLADYWRAALTPSEEESVEEHLLECDPCGSRLREVILLAEGVRKLTREGCLRMIVSDVFLRRAAEEGLPVREYAPPAGGAVECTTLAEDHIVIGRLAADLSRAKRVDLSICDNTGAEQSRMRDIPLRAGASSVAFQESIAVLKAAPTHAMIVRLVGVDEVGGERLLGEYTFNHTRSLPGPGAG